MLSNDNDDRRLLFESCKIKAKRVVNPIIDWSDRDVWDFILSERLPLNHLYCEGFSRVGCIGCPLATKKHRMFEFARFPRYKAMYLKAFGRMLKARKERGMLDGDWRMGYTAIDVYHWWINDGVLPGQIDLLNQDDDEFEDYYP